MHARYDSSGREASQVRPILTSLGIQPYRLGLFEPAFQLFAKDFEINWLRDACITAGFEEALLFGDHGVRRHRDYRDSAKSGLFSHPRSQGKAVLIAELNIQQDGIWPAILEGAYRGGQILNTADFVPFDFEPVAKQFAIQRIVFNHQDVVLHSFTATRGPRCAPVA